MNPKVKKAWVAALRSGEYKQGKDRLRSGQGGNTRFCCLGVLCNLHAQAHPEIAAEQVYRDEYMSHSDFPPPAVENWCGLDAREVEVTIKGRKNTLSEHNDGSSGRRRTFAEIADAIESQL